MHACVHVAQDAADGRAQVVPGAGLHGGLEARLAHLLLPRQALLALLLAVHRAALIAAAVLLTHKGQSSAVCTSGMSDCTPSRYAETGITVFGGGCRGPTGSMIVPHLMTPLQKTPLLTHPHFLLQTLRPHPPRLPPPPRPLCLPVSPLLLPQEPASAS